MADVEIYWTHYAVIKSNYPAFDIDDNVYSGDEWGTNERMCGRVIGTELLMYVFYCCSDWTQYESDADVNELTNR